MVAIPTFLLATSALHSLRPVNPANIAARSPVPEPDTATTAIVSGDDAFGSLLGPLISSNFADPGIIYHEGTSYAFATNNKQPSPDMIHIQMAVSTDNKTWSLLENQDALPTIASWQTGARVWAPDVVRLPNGKFVLYYADELVSDTAHHCVGAAISDKVTGPYLPMDKPFACPDPQGLGGAIDPEGFLDPSDGKRYVVYKVDGNSVGNGGLCGNDVAPIKPTPLMLQEVSTEDGVTHVGEPVQILDRDSRDGPLIEAPALHRSDEGIYFLFFSSSCYTSPLYDVSYATATNIKGPYTKAGTPLLITGDGPELVGPGGMDIIQEGGMVVFHGHMTIDNDAAFKSQLEAKAKKAGKPVKDVTMPLIRGMYSGVAQFNGHTVSLSRS